VVWDREYVCDCDGLDDWVWLGDPVCVEDTDTLGDADCDADWAQRKGSSSRTESKRPGRRAEWKEQAGGPGLASSMSIATLTASWIALPVSD